MVVLVGGIEEKTFLEINPIKKPPDFSDGFSNRMGV